jgi:hypothetical protein
LNQLNVIKPYCIQVGNTKYHYSEVQLIFLSHEAVKHFKKSSETFVIDDQYLRNHSSQISLDDFLYCFKQFHSLFSSTTAILLTPEKLSVFKIFANILDNSLLGSKWI